SLRRQAARPLELHCAYSLTDTPQNDTSEKGEVARESREQNTRRSAFLARAAFCARAVLTKRHFTAVHSLFCLPELVQIPIRPKSAKQPNLLALRFQRCFSCRLTK